MVKHKRGKRHQGWGNRKDKEINNTKSMRKKKGATEKGEKKEKIKIIPFRDGIIH